MDFALGDLDGRFQFGHRALVQLLVVDFKRQIDGRHFPGR